MQQYQKYAAANYLRKAPKKKPHKFKKQKIRHVKRNFFELFWIWHLSFSLQREKFSSFIIALLQNIQQSLSTVTPPILQSILINLYKNVKQYSFKMMTELHLRPGSAYDCAQFYGNRIRSDVHSRSGHDVTDNKTNELILGYNRKPLYTMNENFHREDERLKTFDHWPHDWLDKYQLAQTGMFYTGDADKVKCYFCEVEIGRWELEDQPVSEHLRWSPNCPLLRRRTTNNVPISIEALDRILPPMSYDVCGSNIEIRENAYPEGTITAPRMMTSTAVNTGLNGTEDCMPPSCSNGSSYFPEYPEYAIESARLRSFAEWPRNMKQKPEQLAEAGFFYIGVGDRVKCFSCGGGLKDWDDSDEPWQQHALWLNKCRFLKLIKGQNFIDAVISKHKNEEAGISAEANQNESSTALSDETVKPATDTAAESNVESSNSCDFDPQAVRICKKIFASDEVTCNNAAEKKSSSNIPEEKLCKICYADEYNTAFLPCGHVVACAKCASSVTKCPLCRKPFTDVMRVYFS